MPSSSYLPGQPALGDLGADAGRGEERRDARAAGPHPLGQRALRGQLDLELAVRGTAGRTPCSPRRTTRPSGAAAWPPAAGPGPSRRRRSCWTPPRGRSTPASSSASISTDGMPHSPKPPTDSVAPSAMSATASAALATTLSTRRPPSPAGAPGPDRLAGPASRSDPSHSRRRPRPVGARASPRAQADRSDAATRDRHRCRAARRTRLAAASGCTSSPARAAPASPPSPPRWRWRWPPTGRNVLLCEVEGRQGIARMFDVDPLPYEERRIATGLPPAERRRRASCTRCTSTRSRRCWSTSSMYYKLGRAGKALDRFGVIEFATTIAPGVRDVLLTGKVYEAVQRNARNKSADHVRRGRARRPADRPDHPVPQRQQRARRAGQGRADQEPGRQRDDAVPLPAHRGPPRDRAGGDAGAGDRRRHRRAAPGAACPSAASSSTWCAPATSTPTTSPAARAGTLDREALARRPRRGRRRRTATTPWSTACSSEARDHAERRALEDSQRALVAEPRTSRRTSCPAWPAASTSAGSTSSPPTSSEQGLAS